MEKLRLSEVCEATGGKLVQGDPGYRISGVSIDSREAGSGDLFIALTGGNRDAHEFVTGARERGCEAFLISDVNAAAKLPGANLIRVRDTLKAMQDLAYYYLAKLNIRKVAVTGSVGKTSTRDMVYYILSTKYKTARPDKNYNNEIGVPLTIFKLDKSYEAVVFEEGLAFKGDIHKLTRITRPDVAIITNVGISHLENFGSREELARAKMEIADFLTPDGVLVINSSSDMLDKSKIESAYKVVSVGESVDDEYRIGEIEDRGTEGIKFSVYHDAKEEDIELPIPGGHNAFNASLAIAACEALGIGMDEAKEGLGKLELTGKRLKVRRLNNITVIDDSYNAAPSSMKSAMDTLMNTEGKRHIAILAGMNELGSDSDKFHKEIGRYASKKKVDVVIGVYDKARAIVEGAMEANDGESVTYAAWYPDKEMLYEELASMIREGDVVLIKGSNSFNMSEVADRIMEG